VYKLQTVNITEFWCLLKQHVSTHVRHLQANTRKNTYEQHTLLSVNNEISVYKFVPLLRTALSGYYAVSSGSIIRL